jgi:uncharacterized membrane protein
MMEIYHAGMSDENCLYSLILRPRRSFSLYGINVLVGLLAAVWTAIGLAFAHFGAWPVTGFMGLDVALLWTALYIHHRRSQAFDEIRLSADALTLRQGNRWGREQIHTFQPQWVKVETEGRDARLTLRSHGKAVTFGSFLAPDERHRVAREISAELRKVA